LPPTKALLLTVMVALAAITHALPSATS